METCLQQSKLCLLGAELEFMTDMSHRANVIVTRLQYFYPIREHIFHGVEDIFHFYLRNLSLDYTNFENHSNLVDVNKIIMQLNSYIRAYYYVFATIGAWFLSLECHFYVKMYIWK